MIYFSGVSSDKASFSDFPHMKEINNLRNIMFLFNDVWHSIRLRSTSICYAPFDCITTGREFMFVLDAFVVAVFD